MWLAVGEVEQVEEMRVARALELEHAIMPLFAEGSTVPPTPLLVRLA